MPRLEHLVLRKERHKNSASLLVSDEIRPLNAQPDVGPEEPSLIQCSPVQVVEGVVVYHLLQHEPYTRFLVQHALEVVVRLLLSYLDCTVSKLVSCQTYADLQAAPLEMMQTKLHPGVVEVGVGALHSALYHGQKTHNLFLWSSDLMVRVDASQIHHSTASPPIS